MSKVRLVAFAAVTGLVFGVLLGAPSASGQPDPCPAAGNEIPVEIGDTTLYIDHRGGDNLWIYEESNGEPGLQRGGTHYYTPAPLQFADPCVQTANPDRIIY